MGTRFYLKALIALLALALLLILPACNSARELSGGEYDQVVAFAEPIADNLIQGLETDNYATFSRDFTDKMKSAMNQSSFESLVQTFRNKLGAYQSREITRIEEIQGMIAVVYAAKYSQAENVTMRLVFTKDEPHRVSGLWFNAPELK